MKRSTTLLLSCIAAIALACALCGCSVLNGSSTKYSPTKKTATVSTPSIGKSGTLRVGVSTSNTPFSTQVSGKVVGLDVDIAAALADEMGLNLEIVDVGSNPESALKEGTVDIVMNLDKDDTSLTCWVSDPYIETAVALFAASDSTTAPKSTDKPTIEAQTSSLSAWEVTTQYGDTSLKTASDLKTAFSDLKSGAVKYVASDAVIGSYVSYSGNDGAKIIGLMQKASGYCVGVSSSNSTLKTAVSDALSTISKNGTIDVIETKWLGAPLNLSSYSLTDAAKSASTTSSSSSSNVVAEGNSGTTGTAGSNAVTTLS